MKRLLPSHQRSGERRGMKTQMKLKRKMMSDKDIKFPDTESEEFKKAIIEMWWDMTTPKKEEVDE